MEETKVMNPRKWRSQEALKNAFWQRLGEIGYDKLTILDVAEHAGLNRKTFYRNYESLPDLMQDAFQDLFLEISKAYTSFYQKQSSDPGQYAEYTLQYICCIQERRQYLQLIFDNHLEGFAQEVWKKIYAVATPDYSLLGENASIVLDKLCSFDLFTNFTVFTTWGHIEWVLRHADEPADELLSQTMQIYALFLHTYYVSYRIGEHLAPAPAEI